MKRFFGGRESKISVKVQSFTSVSRILKENVLEYDIRILNYTVFYNILLNVKIFSCYS